MQICSSEASGTGSIAVKPCTFLCLMARELLRVARGQRRCIQSSRRGVRSSILRFLQRGHCRRIGIALDAGSNKEDFNKLQRVGGKGRVVYGVGDETCVSRFT